MEFTIGQDDEERNTKTMVYRVLSHARGLLSRDIGLPMSDLVYQLQITAVEHDHGLLSIGWASPEAVVEFSYVFVQAMRANNAPPLGRLLGNKLRFFAPGMRDLVIDVSLLRMVSAVQNPIAAA